MLQNATAYPYVGSYALLIDDGAAAPQPLELVRIQLRREGEVVVSFPLRDGARGTKRIDPAQLIDGTALTDDERRECFELERQLSDGCLRTPKQKAMKLRRDALRRRSIHAPILKRLLRDASMRTDAERQAA